MHGVLYYSTISGNTRLVGEALVEHFRIMGVTLTLQDVAEDNSFKLHTTKNKLQKNIQKSSPEDGSLQIEDSYSFILFGCGTYAHGQMEKSMRKVLEEEWNNIKLGGIPCAAIGLGDHRYDREYNMYAANQIEGWIVEHGGNLICPALKINRSPLKPNNQKIIEAWARNFITTLRK